MHFKVDDVRIREIKELAPPSQLLREFPCSEKTVGVFGASPLYGDAVFIWRKQRLNFPARSV